jgi:hypothetical protein
MLTGTKTSGLPSSFQTVQLWKSQTDGSATSAVPRMASAAIHHSSEVQRSGHQTWGGL